MGVSDAILSIPGLRVYYRFGEASGVVAYDSSGNGKHGSYVNGPALGAASLTADATNTAVLLDGTNDRVAGPVGLLDTFSVSGVSAVLFFKLATSVSGTNTGYRLVVKFNDLSGFSEDIFQVLFFSTGTPGSIRLSTYRNGAEQHVDTSQTSWVAGTTYCIVATVGPSSGQRIYVNDVLDASDAGMTNVPAAGSADVLVFGENGTGGGGNFPGTIDEAAIFDGELTAAQVFSIYTAATTLTASRYAETTVGTSGIVAYWRMSSTVDATGNGRTLTGAGGVTLGGVAGSIAGDADAATSFDGTDDVASAADFTAGRFTTAFTIRFRIKIPSPSITNRYVLSRNAGATHQTSIIYGFVANKIEFFADGYTGTDPRTGSQITISDSGWHDVAYTYDGTTWAGYLDGAQVFSASRTFALNGASGDGWYLGAANAAAANAVAATIDEVSLFSRALSAVEIRRQQSEALASAGLKRPSGAA